VLEEETKEENEPSLDFEEVKEVRWLCCIGVCQGKTHETISHYMSRYV
jgi:hypothetical protein